jgi:DNA helicase HerA-like ATPase
LAAHTAIIAQSGSGKSFMLGRFLEELVGKTRARLLILDPNCDFAKFDKENTDRWKENDKTEPHRVESDTSDAFHQMWLKIQPFKLMTQYPAVGSGALLPSRIALSWSEIPDGEKARLLQISTFTREIFTRVNRDMKDTDLKAWLRHMSLIDAPNLLPQPNVELGGRILDLLALGLWDQAQKGESVQFAMAPLSHGPPPRVVCLDLASLEQQKQILITAEVTLNALWAARRDEWRRAITKPKDEDNRFPVFVVIDEAHNLAPEPVNEASAGVTEILTRIAMEGRKYGLFLVLVTQRPSRVSSNLLSQCDNLCLMKMSNPADVQLVKERFGFMPASLAARALEFSKGQMVLCGEFVDDPVVVQVSPRRTVEGGRSLRDEAWLCEP